jgi:hypothetical protein
LTTTQKKLTTTQKKNPLIFSKSKKIEWLAHKNPKIRKLGRNLTKHTKITHTKPLTLERTKKHIV